MPRVRRSNWPAAKTDADFAPYLEGAAESTVRLFRRFVELARAGGPVTFELQRGPVVLCGSRRIFASVAVAGQGLRGHLVLPHPLDEDHRLTKAEPLTRTLIFHRYRVRSGADLDQRFAGWLREARRVGDGTVSAR